MKIPGMEGEYFFRALVPNKTEHQEGWELSKEYFLSEAEVVAAYGVHYFWPVEIDENGVVYVPDKGEYDEEI